MVLTYHDITAAPDPYRYSLTVALFAQHVGILAERRHAVEVTFDDGHRSNYELALPVLERHGVKATFFITAGWINSSGYMTSSELRELLLRGHRVQAHGWSHEFLTACGEQGLRRELDQAKSTIEDITGQAVDALSAPGGRWSERVAASCRRAGYSTLYTSDAWSRPRALDELSVVGRFMICRETGAAEFARVVDPDWMARARGIAAHGVKRLIRAAAGDNGYHRLWHALAARSGRS